MKIIQHLFLIASFFLPRLAWAQANVVYVTDLEGSRLRFEAFLRDSEAFERDGRGRFHLKPDFYFVFGGDAPDRYLGSLWVVEELVRLKQETPDRVALILGNRDINKMRLPWELSPEALRHPPVRYHFTNEDIWRRHHAPESRAERLKFILTHTMGAPRAFDLRKQEIAANLGLEPSEVGDEPVVDSFLLELGPNGAFWKFLKLGQLAHRIGNTLFVHGGVTAINLGMVPGLDERRSNIDDWISDLNRWLSFGVELWSSRPPNQMGYGERPEQAWLDYPISRPGMNTKPESVVTGRTSDPLNNPLLPPEALVNELLAQGIRRLVIGHTPTGDYPVSLRTHDDQFEVISADVSYTKPENYAPIVRFSGDRLEKTTIRGLFTFEEQLHEVFTEHNLGDPSYMGKIWRGGLLLGRLISDPRVFVSFRYLEGYKVSNQLIHESSLQDCSSLLMARWPNGIASEELGGKLFYTLPIKGMSLIPGRIIHHRAGKLDGTKHAQGEV